MKISEMISLRTTCFPEKISYMTWQSFKYKYPLQKKEQKVGLVLADFFHALSAAIFFIPIVVTVY